VCAECGTPWKPSDFDLRVNAVRFCCPACGQAYYGTSFKGQLEPTEFACVTCGAACSMDGNMVMRPATGMEEQEVQWDAMPWPPRYGSRISDSLRMLGLVIGSPYTVGRNLRAQRDMGLLLWIVLLSAPISLGVLGTFAMKWLVDQTGRGGVAMRPSEMTSFVLWTAGAIVGPPLALLGLSAFCGSITWCVMRGSDERTSFGTAQACWAFGAAPLVVMLVPFVGVCPGGPIGLLGTVVLAMLMIQTAFVADVGRKLLAALLPPALIVLGVIGFTVFSAILRPPGPPAPAFGGPTTEESAPFDSSDEPYSPELPSSESP